MLNISQCLIKVVRRNSHGFKLLLSGKEELTLSLFLPQLFITRCITITDQARPGKNLPHVRSYPINIRFSLNFSVSSVAKKYRVFKASCDKTHINFEELFIEDNCLIYDLEYYCGRKNIYESIRRKYAALSYKKLRIQS